MKSNMILFSLFLMSINFYANQNSQCGLTTSVTGGAVAQANPQATVEQLDDWDIVENEESFVAAIKREPVYYLLQGYLNDDLLSRYKQILEKEQGPTTEDMCNLGREVANRLIKESSDPIGDCIKICIRCGKLVNFVKE